MAREHRAPGEAEDRHQESTTLVEHGLFDHLICLEEDRLRDREAERLRGLHVDHQLELRGLLDGQVAWFGTLEDLVGDVLWKGSHFESRIPTNTPFSRGMSFAIVCPPSLMLKLPSNRATS